MLLRAAVVLLLGLVVGACALGRAEPGELSVPDVDASDPTPTPRPRDSGTYALDASTGADARSPTPDSGSPATDASDASSSTCVTVPPNNRCGLVPQCGCNSGETCDVTNDTTGATSCVTGGTLTQGRQCTGTGNCVAGLTCVFGTCRPYCTTDNQACPGSGVGICFSPEYAPGQTTPNRKVCAITCDPLNPSGACGTNGCFWFTAQRQSDCRPPGTKTVFQSCTRLDECVQGYVCNTHPTFGPECEKWCRLPAGTYAADCPVGTCRDIFGVNAPTSGGASLGLCQ